MFSTVSLILWLNIFCSCVSTIVIKKRQQIPNVILINSRVKLFFYFIQLYVQTVDSFKINVLVRSAKLLYRDNIKNQFLYPKLNTLSYLLRDILERAKNP